MYQVQVVMTAVLLSLTAHLMADDGGGFVPVTDKERVIQRGEWAQGGGKVDGRSRNRYTWPLHLRTKTPDVALEVPFTGTGIAAIFHTPRVRAYGGQWRDGQMRGVVDGGEAVDFLHDEEALEVVLADGMVPGEHRAVLTHLANGCTLAGFRVFEGSVGHVEAAITGDNPKVFFDVRVRVWQGEKLVRESLNRNWLNNRLRVTGLPTGNGYRVVISAIGWVAWERDGIAIAAGQTVDLGSIHLKQDPATVRGPLSRPALGNPVICVPGEDVVIEGGDGGWRAAQLTRRRGPATFSRPLVLADRTVRVPEDMPPGVYDLHLLGDAGKATISPRSVVVRQQHASGDLTVLTWGHTDTWGQHQAEFEQALMTIANVVGPDFVLVSNSVNPAYIAGAMASLDAPYVINFGNHGFKGFENWFGRHIGLVDLGPEFVVVNWGLRWREETKELTDMFSSRKEVPGKILNTFESDWPMELFTDHDIRMVHDAHGWLKPRVQVLPGTETMRVGKISASSFRITRFAKHRVISVSDAFEVPRIEDPAVPIVPPTLLRTEQDGLTARVINELSVPIPQARLVMVLPAGTYQVEPGEVKSAILSDDGRWSELTIRVDVAAESTQTVEVEKVQ